MLWLWAFVALFSIIISQIFCCCDNPFLRNCLVLTGSLITYPSKVDAFLRLMELDQNNKLDDFVISRYESFTVPKVTVLHCNMVPTIYLQGEYSLLSYHSEVSLQKRCRSCLLSYYSKILQLYLSRTGLHLKLISRKRSFV